MKYILLTLLFSSLLCSLTRGQPEDTVLLQSPVPVPVTHLTGTLERRIAIGAETTGWALRHGNKKRIELLLPKDALVWVKDGLVVAVSGVYGTKHYIERGDVSVFIVETITRVVK